MRSDALLNFLPIGANVPILAVPVASNIIDLLSLGSGVDPRSELIIGNATLFGEDPGIGGKRPEINVGVGTTFTTGAGATLKIALQAAPDAGTPTFAPGTWTDVVSQDGIAAADLVAGAIPFRVPWLPVMPANMRPRFLRLLFTPSAAFTAGTIAFALVVPCRDDQANKFATRNYAVG